MLSANIALLKHIIDVLADEIFFTDAPCAEEEDQNGNYEEHIDQECQEVGVWEQENIDPSRVLILVKHVLHLTRKLPIKNPEVLLLYLLIFLRLLVLRLDQEIDIIVVFATRSLYLRRCPLYRLLDFSLFQLILQQVKLRVAHLEHLEIIGD